MAAKLDAILNAILGSLIFSGIGMLMGAAILAAHYGLVDRARDVIP